MAVLDIMGKEKDTILLKKVFHFYGYWAMFPYLKKYKFAIMVLFHLLAIMVVGVTVAYSNSSLNLSIVGFSIYNAFYLVIILFDLLCLKNCYNKKDTWIKLFSDIEFFDSIMEGQISDLTESVPRYFSKFAIVNIFLTANFILTTIVFTRALHCTQIIVITYLYFLCNQIFVTALMFVKLLGIVGKRYDFLRTTVKQVYSPGNAFERPCDSQHLKSLYFLLYTIVKNINNIFGQKILLTIFITFLDILAVFQSSLLEDFRIKNKDINYIISMILTVLQLVST